MTAPEKAGSSSTGLELLPSKLAVPELRPGLVPRPTLVSRLEVPTSARVVSLSAPAGYGKTTLLAQWAADDPREFAWLSLDHRDNDPALFLTYLAAAVDGIEPVDARVFRAAASGGNSLWTIGLPRLGAALAAIDRPIVLVLDDVHELRERDCLDALEPIAKHLPEGAQLVLSGRSEGGLPLARLRAAGRLLALGPAELALTDGEAKALLAAAGIRVTDREAATLNERTEGWAAGLYLAALVAQEAGADGLSSFAGDDRFVVDYLRDEHLSRLKRTDIQFLTRTSILDRMSAVACDDLLERSDSARKLETLERTNCFVVPLDHHREWYRYHHLFRDVLLFELDRLEPELVPALHRRAASWSERNGLPDAAIEHAAAAGDKAEVARLVSIFALPFYRSGRVVTVERWFERFDDGELRSYPAIAGFAAIVSAFRGRPEEAERYRYALERSENDGPMPDGSSSPEPWAALVRAMLCNHGVTEMGADAGLALDGMPPSSFLHPVALGLQGLSMLFDGEMESALELLKQTAEEAAGSGAVYVGVIAYSELALAALERNDLERAEAELAAARTLLDRQPIEEYVAAALYLAAAARAALAKRQSASARELLVRATRLRPQLTHAVPWLAVQTSLELSRVHLAFGDVEGARMLFREASDVLGRRPELGALREQVRELENRLANTATLEDGWASTLTAAELRLLPLLTTHLTFREIAERLYVSRNTVKSQAISVYRKLGASSRSEAIDRALELGLVDAPVASGSSFTPAG
ncbi:MAG TPA: LuxR C-terminal-related transcriptional regulator [Gaiellaceae bacterium]|nr:LuxR C-terminal-related transcriptional regulator [Gaiellaceae bacterium]